MESMRYEGAYKAAANAIGLIVCLGMSMALPAVADELPIKVYPLNLAPKVASKPPSAALTPGGAGSGTTDLAARLREAIAAKSASTRAPSTPNPASTAQSQAVEILHQQSSGTAQVLGLEESGIPRQIKGNVLEPAASVAGSEKDRDRITAHNFLFNQQHLLGLTQPSAELRLSRYAKDDLGRRHLRYRQTFNGIPIWPAEVIVHLDEAGNVDAFDGGHVPTPKKPILTPVIDAADALKRARQEVKGGDKASADAPELVFYAPNSGEPTLAWKVRLEISPLKDLLVLIDAINGATLNSSNQVTDANVSGSGTDLQGVVRPLSVWQANGSYSMENTSKPMFEPSKDPLAIDSIGVIHIWNANYQPATSNPPDDANPALFYVKSPNATSGWIPDAVSAAFNFSETYDYYLERHQRNSLDGKGGSIKAVVRYARNFFNAFWNPAEATMYFGTADTFAGALDVVGHELTHGVTTHSANLVYQDQPGALNEAISDIFGEAIEARSTGRNDWLLGTNMQNRLRSMKNPASFGDPEKLSQYVRTRQDHGGVHTNSGIINRAYYLLVEGLNGGIGMRDAERIFYRALTVHLLQNSQFIDARHAAILSAEELFGQGSVQAQRTAQAFDAVEIFDSASTPKPPNKTPDSGTDSSLFLYYDGGRSDWFLARKELNQNDSAGGNYLSKTPMAAKAPSVSTDGALAVYVSKSHDLCLIETTKPDSETCLGFTGRIASVAMSADANRYAFIFRNAVTGDSENRISIIDLGSSSPPHFYTLQAPVADGPAINIDHADAMDFTSDGHYLIFDAFNTYTINGQSSGSWSIYALDLVTGNFLTVIPPQQNIDIGNPTTGRTRPDIITFDVVNKTNASKQSRVFVANINSGDLISFNPVVNGWYAIPHFTADDRNIQYSTPDNSAYSAASIWLQPLAEDNLTPVNAPTQWIPDGDYSTAYRRPSAANIPPPQAQWTLQVVNTARSIGDTTVLSLPPGINCRLITKPQPTQSGACQAQFPANSSVTLSIDPASGLMFDGDPSGCDDGGNHASCSVNIRFETTRASIGLIRSPKLIAVSRTGEGRVSGAGINCGKRCAKQFGQIKRVRLRATPKRGWRLDAWQGCDSAKGKVCLVNVHSPRAIQALFGRKIK